MKLWIYLILFWFVSQQESKKNVYYINANGNDENDGLSIKTAWRSIEKVNLTTFKAGDKVLFEGGVIFKGSILLDSLDNGTERSPIIISSYGTKPAIIQSDERRGLFAYNCEGIRVSRLSFFGDGVGRNKQNGIEFYTDYVSKSLHNIEIDSCEVKGFHKYGILILGDKSDTSGYRDVRITNTIAHENGEAGIGSLAKYPAIPHKNFYLAFNKVFNNRGIPAKTHNHSGNGIVMAGINDVLIELCEAYENGADNRCINGGPVGIWLWACREGTIQNCESHHNHAGLTKDGGGFDIDGGSTNCVIRNCYSHDNEGAGYLFAQFNCPLKFRNNKIIDNISQNDGLKNNYGSITFWGDNEDNEIIGCEVRNNKCYVEAKNVVNGTPCGVRLSGIHFKGIKVLNNYFEIAANAKYIFSDKEVSPDKVYYKNNTIEWGKKKVDGRK
ncbi:right-handed parallel beta-helix repeat-containing protein [Emticicia sp. BO119]|uniref:right-handed parallel beta-helix repeat-containing protein n=1 Tax=Emticicia sp. BO119 TaxID=2757768 RepID=UPI0015F0293A|nr:right-handed parallel beta-helix repeat-containing protein [Emticicia sp. BO119]MBA4850125.1 right-handed parallel beta-helix repeat-containing protein [Emticicia sp. BO119]